MRGSRVGDGPRSARAARCRRRSGPGSRRERASATTAGSRAAASPTASPSSSATGRRAPADRSGTGSASRWPPNTRRRGAARRRGGARWRRRLLRSQTTPPGQSGVGEWRRRAPRAAAARQLPGALARRRAPGAPPPEGHACVADARWRPTSTRTKLGQRGCWRRSTSRTCRPGRSCGSPTPPRTWPTPRTRWSSRRASGPAAAVSNAWMTSAPQPHWRERSSWAAGSAARPTPATWSSGRSPSSPT
jgi:hypothetical protein